MRTITIELEAQEAHMILDPIRDAALDDQRRVANGEDDWLSVRAQVRARIAERLIDQLIPESDEVGL